MRALLLALTGCFAGVESGDPLALGTADTDAPANEAGTSTAAPPDDDDAQACVDGINAYRATLGLPAYGRWTDAEDCVGDQAHTDHDNNVAHSAFGECGEWAQNECPGWPGPAGEWIQDCLDMMWAEGPGEDFDVHGHYINMSSEDYTEVACGFYELPDGSWWGAQDFR